MCSLSYRPNEPREAKQVATQRLESQDLAGHDMYEVGQPSPDLQNEVVSLAAALGSPEPSAPRSINDRKHPRIALPSARACVKHPDADEEIVELVNVSRGGASFRSNRVYPLGCWIRIAAPCTIGTDNIFALGRVVRVTNAEHGREYGVEYVDRQCRRL